MAVALDIFMPRGQVQGQIFLAPPHGVADIATEATWKSVVVGSLCNGVIVSRIIRFSGRYSFNCGHNKICGDTWNRYW